MAATTGQRVFIWSMAVIMLVGTLGSFFIFVLEADNGPVKSSAESTQEEQMAEYQKMLEEQARKRAESSKPIGDYEASKFNADEVNEVKVEVLKEGDGEEVKADSVIKANYFGWTADGKIFDSTNQDGDNQTAEFGLNQVIVGWREGLTGTNVGDIVELTIPADKAYGEAGSPPLIGPNQPLKFIVEVVGVSEAPPTQE